MIGFNKFNPDSKQKKDLKMNKYLFLILSSSIFNLNALRAPETPRTKQTTTREYAYIYMQTDQELKQGESVAFDSNGKMSNGIKHAENSSEIIFEKAGTYQVSFLGTTTAAGSCALFLNGKPMKGSEYGAISYYFRNMQIQAIITTNAGDKLTVRNYSPVLGQASLRFAVGKPGKQQATNASILIVQID